MLARMLAGFVFALMMLGALPTESHAVLFRRPLPSYVGVHNFYDHSGKDWGCGRITYGGHRGTDFAVNMSNVPIYAAAGGSLYYRYDECPTYGYFGSNCGGGLGNHVRIEHSDGRVSVYAHMAKGTPAWYSSVWCGSRIGIVGQSGSASTPHLHFDVWNNRSGSTRIDPYAGDCDRGSSDWTYQSSYPSGYVGSSCW